MKYPVNAKLHVCAFNITIHSGHDTVTVTSDGEPSDINIDMSFKTQEQADIFRAAVERKHQCRVNISIGGH